MNTDKQEKEHELLTRADQTDRIMEMLDTVSTIEEAKEECRKMKKVLREKADQAL